MKNNWKVMSLTFGSTALAGVLIVMAVPTPNFVAFVKGIILAAVTSSLIGLFKKE